MGEDHGRWEETGNTIDKSFGIWEAVCMKGVVRNWRDPTCHPVVKKMRISKMKRNGMPYAETCQYPCKKAMKKMKSAIKENINQRNKLPKSEEELIRVINPKIVGWRNYYKTRNDGKWLRAIDWYILCTFTRWYNKKHQNSRSLKGLYRMKLNLINKGLQQMAA